MTYERGEEVRRLILRQISEGGAELTSKVSKKSKVQPQAVRKHLREMLRAGLIETEGNTRDRTYSLKTTQWTKTYYRKDGLQEDQAWNEVEPFVGKLPENVLSIWNTGFTEMFNNAIDHSDATEVMVTARKNAVTTEIEISDNGVGIFKKIKDAMKLPDEDAAIVELAKGKFTTDSTKHSGEGIFFTSKMFDSFDILSGDRAFLKSREAHAVRGTTVWMKLDNESTRQPMDIYNQYAIEEFAFDKTNVPLRLAQFGGKRLVSRSQAKRILNRMEKFKGGAFDFAGVEYVGQAFADEIFRVFRDAHPEFKLTYFNASPEILKMIQHVEQRNPVVAP